MGEENKQQQPRPQGQPSGDRRDDFALRTRQSSWRGQTITMREPPLVEALALADEYSDIVMETVQGRNIMRVRIRESQYVAAVLSKYFDPPIDVDKLPARVYAELRKLINEWEDWSGMRALRETIRAQAEAQ